MTIRVEIKNHYGTEHIYPLNRQKELRELTGQKTLSSRHIEALKALGFNFEVVTNHFLCATSVKIGSGKDEIQG